MAFSKYRARRTTIDGISFASEAEANLYAELILDVQNGTIRDLKMQQAVKPEPCLHCGMQPAPSVKVDFSATEIKTGQKIHYEMKGVVTDRWRDFANWWRHSGPTKLRIYAPGKRGRVRFIEEIDPKANK